MIKTDKVKEVKDLQRTDNYGNHSFIVSFENGDSGFMNSKEKVSTYFVVGRSVEYDVDEKPKKDGSGTYTTIKRPKKDFAPGGGGGSKWQPKTKKEYLSDAISFFSRYATDVLIAQKKEVTVDTLKPLVYAYFEVAKPLFDKLHGED